jgi:hypothetical protein
LGGRLKFFKQFINFPLLSRNLLFKPRPFGGCFFSFAPRLRLSLSRGDKLLFALAFYAYLDHQWVKCISVHAVAFQGRSEKELMLASTKLLRAAGVGHRQQCITAKKLAEFFMSVEGEERLRKQHLRDLAAQRAALVKVPKSETVLDYMI